MATINLRLAPKLEDRARLHSDELGISINALASVAIDTYFRTLDASVRYVAPVETFQAESKRPHFNSTPLGNHGDNKISPPGLNASKKERQAWTAFQRQQRKLEL